MEEFLARIADMEERLEALEIEEIYLRYSLKHLQELKQNVESGKTILQDKG